MLAVGAEIIRAKVSHPSRGAWIEIPAKEVEIPQLVQSHPSRGAWIEIVDICDTQYLGLSHPSRGAWIEIIIIVNRNKFSSVAPLAGCVD